MPKHVNTSLEFFPVAVYIPVLPVKKNIQVYIYMYMLICIPKHQLNNKIRFESA